MVGVKHMMVLTPETPFGGVNESGYGSESGIEGLDAYLRTKFVTEMQSEARVASGCGWQNPSPALLRISQARIRCGAPTVS